jgi:hypothetical protein
LRAQAKHLETGTSGSNYAAIKAWTGLKESGRPPADWEYAASTRRSLSGGVVLNQDNERVDHFVILPTEPDGAIARDVNMSRLAVELGLMYLDLVQDEEDPWDLTAEGWRATVANVGGIEVAAA